MGSATESGSSGTIERGTVLTGDAALEEDGSGSALFEYMGGNGNRRRGHIQFRTMEGYGYDCTIHAIVAKSPGEGLRGQWDGGTFERGR